MLPAISSYTLSHSLQPLYVPISAPYPVALVQLLHVVGLLSPWEPLLSREDHQNSEGLCNKKPRWKDISSHWFILPVSLRKRKGNGKEMHEKKCVLGPDCWFFQQCPKGPPWCGIWLSGRHGRLHRLPCLNLHEGKNICVGLEIHSIGIPPLETASDWRFRMYGCQNDFRTWKCPYVSSSCRSPLPSSFPCSVWMLIHRMSSSAWQAVWPLSVFGQPSPCSTDSTKHKRWKLVFRCKKRGDEAH